MINYTKHEPTNVLRIFTYEKYNRFISAPGKAKGMEREVKKSK